MVPISDVLGHMVRRFAPSLAAIMLMFVVVESLGSGAGLARLRQVHWPVAAGEVLVVSAAYAGVLLACRRRLRSGRLAGWRGGGSAAALAVGTLLVLSIFSQPASLGRIALLSVAAGLVAGGLTAGARMRERRGVSAAT